MGMLDGKVAIITGGTSGIGEKSAELFVAEGAKVVFTGRRQSEGEAVAKRLGANATFLQGDATSEDHWVRLLRLTLDRHGRLDALFNNAGGPAQTGGIEGLTVENFDSAMALLVRSVMLGMKHAAPVMKKQRGGKIINVASGTFFHGSGNMPHYTTSKGGVVAMTRVLAKQLGPWNINVNCLTPGSTMSEEKATDEALQNYQRSASSRILKRIEEPEDLVGTALYLLSDLSSFVTGQTILVNGGAVLH